METLDLDECGQVEFGEMTIVLDDESMLQLLRMLSKAGRCFLLAPVTLSDMPSEIE
jgi:hypothetical protein